MIGVHALKYCVDLLTNRPASNDYEELVEMKHKIHNTRMKEINLANESPLTLEMFYEAVEDLRKSKSEKYKFIIKAGGDFKYAFFNLFSYIWEHEKIPEQWKLDTLLQIHKKRYKTEAR